MPPTHPLHLAAHQGNTAELRRLLDTGIDPNTIASDTTTPLHWAASWDREEAGLLLLERGADPGVVDDEGETPLHLAARKGHSEPRLVERMLRFPGLDLNAKEGKRGWTALHGAAQRGRMDIVRILLDAGAEVNPLDGSGCTPLDLARRKHRIDVMELLRQYGAKCVK